MTLNHSFQKSGNFLFKYRGQIPLFIFVLGMPILIFSNHPLYAALADGSLGVTFKTTILIVSVLISLLGFLIRAYTIATTPRGTSGRNTKKQVAEQLNTKGIYSIIRHPLYLGNYLMWAGLLIFTMNPFLFLIVSLFFWLYYERIMFAEEAYLGNRFGQQFVDWANQVPPFIPAFGKFEKGNIPFSFKAILRREYTGLFAMTLVYAVIDYVLNFTIHFLYHKDALSLSDYLRPSLYCLLVVLVITLILRTLKHYTGVLNPEADRD
jgi:protein-S-isoprenylcysteine O-methyltransferase Ste14